MSIAEASIEERLRCAGLPALGRTAWLEIDLGALVANLEILRQGAGPGVRAEPVVKADAYGHGALPVSLALEAAGADGLSVATFDEAVELREGGVTLPILVLYPIPETSVEEAMRLGVATALGPGLLCERILTAAEAASDGDPGLGPLVVHLEVETGLGRGGVLPGEVRAALARIAAARGVRLEGIWTHFAAADDPASRSGQDGRFEAMLASLGDDVPAGADGTPLRRHIGGSGTVVVGDVRRWDAARLGLALYGLLPDGLEASPEYAVLAAGLRPVMEVRARPVRVEVLPAGHGVSYGPSWRASRPSRIATLPIGYADGWRRFLTDRSEALVRGVRVPLVGRVAMDGIMADVTDVPGAPVTEDDEFVLLGAQGDERITAPELARTGTTITHEVLAGMSRRLARVYHSAGSIAGMRMLAGASTRWLAAAPDQPAAPSRG